MSTPRTVIRSAIFGSSLLAIVAGCDLFDSDPPPPTLAPTPGAVAPAIPGGLSIQAPAIFRSTDHGHVKVTSTYGNIDYNWVGADGAVTLVVQATPGGTVSIQNTPVALDATGKGSYRVDLLPHLLAATTETVTGQGIASSSTLTLAVTPSGGAPGTITLDLADYLDDGVRQLFSSVAAGRPLQGITGDETRKSLLYLPHFTTQKPEHFGQAGTIADVDLVAIATEAVAGIAGTCGPYDSGKTYPRQNVDIEVKVYSVRTGQAVATQRFSAAEEQCSTFVFVSGDGDPVKVYAAEAKIKTWLAQQI